MFDGLTPYGVFFWFLTIASPLAGYLLISNGSCTLEGAAAALIMFAGVVWVTSANHRLDYICRHSVVRREHYLSDEFTKKLGD